MKKIVISLIMMILSLSVACNVSAKDRKKTGLIFADAKISYDISEVELRDTIADKIKKI